MIYNEDCLEGMARLEAGSVDLIATDPPYCVGVSSNGTRSSFSDFNLMRPFFEQCFREWRRVLKDGGHVYMCTDWRTYPFLYPIMLKHLTVRNLIVWDIQWLKAGNFYRPTHELIIFATKDKSVRTWSASETDIWRIKCVNYTKERWHSAEKPIELMERMIRNSTTAGELVLDPFLGSGTTAIAARNLGREFVGFEIDEKTFSTAQLRIMEDAAMKSQLLFPA